MRYVALFLVVLLLIGALAYWFLGPGSAEEEPLIIDTGPPPPRGLSVVIPDKNAPPKYTAADFSWTIASTTDYEETMPMGIVSLLVGETSFEIGTSTGCSTSTEEVVLIENEVTRLSCWFEGAGTDFSVFLEDRVYRVKKRITEESSDDEEEIPTEGLFEAVVTLEI